MENKGGKTKILKRGMQESRSNKVAGWRPEAL